MLLSFLHDLLEPVHEGRVLFERVYSILELEGPRVIDEVDI